MAVLQPKSPTEFLMYNTVRIIATFPGSAVRYGTGFFFTFKRGTTWVPTIISNKHVLYGCKSVEFLVHHGEIVDGRNNPTGKSLYVTTENRGALVFPHPDPDVDLCCISSGQLTREMQERGITIYAQHLTQDDLPSEGELRNMNAVEDVLMVGYPNALWDEVNNFPLFRRGITATHPAVEFNGKSIMVVDMACFPGSSGSPVIWAGDQLKLLGVLHAGPRMTQEGRIEIRNIPTAQTPIAVTQAMMHLGYVIKAKEVAAMGDAFFSFFDHNQPARGETERVVQAVTPAEPSAPPAAPAPEEPKAPVGVPRPPRTPRSQKRRKKK